MPARPPKPSALRAVDLSSLPPEAAARLASELRNLSTDLNTFAREVLETLAELEARIEALEP